MQNPMLFKNGVVSESIAGVRQFRTRAQTNKNTKQRKDEFAISSGSPPPTGPDPQAFLVLCLAVPGFQRHRFPSKGKGREANTTCNRRSLPPRCNPHLEEQLRTKAQRPWTVKPSNTNLGHQNNTAGTCNTHCISKPVWVHQWQGCSNSAPRCKPAITQKTKRRVRHFFRESTSNKSRSASLPGVVFGGSRVSATSFPPQGQRARSEHSLQQQQPAPPQCNPHLEEQLRTKAQRPRTDTPPNQQAPTWETKAKGQQPQQPNAFQNRCGE